MCQLAVLLDSLGLQQSGRFRSRKAGSCSAPLVLPVTRPVGEVKYRIAGVGKRLSTVSTPGVVRLTS